MQLLYDMPIPLGEPHYAQMIKADKLNPIDIYTPAGVRMSITGAQDPERRRGRQRAYRASRARTVSTST